MKTGARRLIKRRQAKLARRLAGTAVSIVTAESCTGGQLAAALAADAALGPHLERGFVAYSIDAKCEQLGIARDTAERNDAVTAEVTAAMADGALKNSRADIAIAITGFCGPQEKNEEVGLVFLACADRKSGRWEETWRFGDLGREAVLAKAVAAALALLVHATDGGN